MKISDGFKYFLKKFLKFVIILGIVFYINISISDSCKNIKSYNYNKSLLYFLFLYFILFISDIYTYESKTLNKFIYSFIFCIITIYLTNYLLKKYLYIGFFTNFCISIGFSLLIFLIFALSFYYSVESKGIIISDPIFLHFNFADFNNNSMTNFITFFFPICGLLFWLTNYNNKVGVYLNQNIMGFLSIIFICYLGFYYAIKIKLITSKQILNTFLSYLCILYIISVFQSYFLLDSINNVCNGQELNDKNKNDNAFVELLFNLLLVSIIFIIILNDIRKWSFYNYLIYLLITIYVFICLISLSTTYPSLGLLSFYSFIEWCILTAYNNNDTFNSFSFVMMNHKYNLTSKNIEGK